MILSLNGLVPVPMQEQIQKRASGIWQQSIELSQGTTASLVAPSGTGKSTLLHILYGLRKDYEGDALWDGNSIKYMSGESLAVLRAQDVSIIFQDLRLFQQLTVRENLELKRRLSNTVTSAEMTAWLLRLGIGDKENKKLATLSYGEQQRVAIIRGLLQPFRWLLMDEAFSHLDLDNRLSATALIQEVVERNNAGLLVAELDTNHYFNYSQTLYL